MITSHRQLRTTATHALLYYGVLCCGLMLMSAVSLSAEAPSAIRSIEQVESLVSDASHPPSEALPWETVRLFGAQRTGTSYGQNQRWFRFTLEAPGDPQELYALYFWRYNMNITVYLNGALLGGDAFRPGLHTQAWNRAMLIPIQPGNWVQGTNVVHVRFSPSPFGGTFAPVRFGPLAELEPIHRELHWWKVQVNEYLLVFGFLVTLCAAALWLSRRHDRIYLWFIGVSVSWCVVLSHMVIYFNPIAYDTWLRFVHMAVDSWIFCLFGFGHRLLNLPAPKGEKVMLFLWCAAMASHLLTPNTVFWASAYVMHVLLVLGLFLLFVRVIKRAVVARDQLAISVVVAVIGQVLFSAHDFWLFFSASEKSWETASHFGQFGVPLILSVLLVSLLRRFTQALDESENLNRELEDRAEATRRALQSSFDEKREDELAQAAVDERQKIYRDLHDDVGSKLLSIIHQEASDEASSGLASAALESLRESIYRANYDDERLLDLLLLVREEAKLRMSRAGVAFEWFEDPDLENELLDAGQCYQLSRIFREVFSNALNHSGCRKVMVQVEADAEKPGWLRLEVIDDGNGALVPDAVGSSGLKNIQFRADALGAEASWQAAANEGTTFSLVFEPRTSQLLTPQVAL